MIQTLMLTALLGLLGPPGEAARWQEPASAPAAVEAPETPRDPASKTQSLEERRALIPTLFEGCLQDTHNGDDFVETPGYRRLLEILFNYQRAEVSSRARTDFDYAQCVAEPDLWRGEFVRLRGVLVDPQAVKLRQPISGREDVWRGVLTETDGSEGVMFDILDRPPDGLVDRRTIVDLEGLVLRTVRYENRDGKIIDAPYVLARSLVAADITAAPKRNSAEPFMIVLICLAVLFVVGRIVLAMRKHGSPRGTGGPRQPSFHQMFLRAESDARRTPKDQRKK